MIRPIIQLCVAGTLSAASLAHATTYCATNSAQLQKVLTLASGNGEDDTIRIATGTYPVPAGGFSYDTLVPGGDEGNLMISGGWTAFFENPCGQQLTETPWLTVLDGDETERILDLGIRSDSSLDVRLLTFLDGNAVGDQDEFFGKGGGIRVRHSPNFTGVMRIERNVFYHNAADIGGGLHIADGNAQGTGRVYVVNNLFISNQSRYENNGASAAFISLPHGHIYLTNNTAMYNSAEGLSGGFMLAYSNILAANNNIWANDACDLNLDMFYSDDRARLDNNNIEDLCGDPPTAAYGNISVEPEFEGGILNFTPVYYSPLVNAGRPPPSVGTPPFFWYLTDLDLSGEPRVVGPRVDIGALESQEAELIFVNGFDSAIP